MKNLIILLVLIIVSCSKSKLETNPEINLNGEWIGKGYQCPFGTTINEEIIKIEHKGNEIIASKIVGDPCVPAGNITFKGSYNADKDHYDVIWTSGSPNQPACCSYSGILKVTDKNTLNTFSVYDIKEDVYFIRK